MYLLLKGMFTPAGSPSRSRAAALESCAFQSWNSSSPGPAAPHSTHLKMQLHRKRYYCSTKHLLKWLPQRVDASDRCRLFAFSTGNNKMHRRICKVGHVASKLDCMHVPTRVRTCRLGVTLLQFPQPLQHIPLASQCVVALPTPWDQFSRAEWP